MIYRLATIHPLQTTMEDDGREDHTLVPYARQL